MLIELPIVSEFDPTTSTSKRGRQIECGACGATDMVTAPVNAPVMPMEPTIKKLQQRGWLIGKRAAAHRCPNCNPNRKPKMSAEKPKPKPIPTPAASKKITDLYMTLDDRYDREAKNYRVGWTDTKIAEELGLSVDLVAKRREQDFGPLVVPVFVIPPEAVAGLDDVDRRLGELFSALSTGAAAFNELCNRVTMLRETVDDVKKAIRK